LAASRDADGKDVVEIQSDIVKFRSPLPVEQSANLQGSARKPRAKTPEIGGTESYCTGEDYPGEIGDKQACLAASECDGLCTNGDDGLIGAACTADAQCNTPGTSDGLCSSASICQTYAIMTIAGNNIFFDGFNVHVRSGAGATWGTADFEDWSYADLPEQGNVNGLGNLIIGYDEDRVLLDPLQPIEKTGSHNLVIGPFHTYDRIGGFVTGLANNIRGHYASVSGGYENTASGYHASVAGGRSNEASGPRASITGGSLNVASAENSSVTGATSIPPRRRHRRSAAVTGILQMAAMRWPAAARKTRAAASRRWPAAPTSTCPETACRSAGRPPQDHNPKIKRSDLSAILGDSCPVFFG
jgi:hypothetical protein